MAWMVLVFVLTVPQMVLAGHPIVTQDTIYIRDTVYVKHTTVIMGGKPKKEKPTPVLADQSKVWALKTNLALWGVVVAPNIQFELPLGHDNRWSIEAEYFQPWFRWSDNTRATQCLNLGVEARRWLGKRQYHRCLEGWHVGLAFAAGYYNIEWKKSDGYQGEYINPYVNIGYQYRLGKHWAMDFGLGVGCLITKYRHYLGSSVFPEGRTEAHDDHLMWQENGTFVWPGPNHVSISIVYLFNWKKK